MELTLYNGDYREIIGDVKVDAVLTDPPYGGKFNTKYTRFSGGSESSKRHRRGIPHPPIHGDDEDFDPSPLLSMSVPTVLFGSQFFSDKLDTGTILVWVKKRDDHLGSFLSDAEIAWMNKGHGVYVFKHEWNGFIRESERGKSVHPTQKPVALMEWVLSKMNLPDGATVFDPFMGSGPVGVACANMGYGYVGCEIVPEYFDIAESRITEAWN